MIRYGLIFLLSTVLLPVTSVAESNPTPSETRIAVDQDSQWIDGIDFIPTVGLSSFKMSTSFSDDTVTAASTFKQGFVIGTLANIGTDRRVFETGILYYEAGSQMKLNFGNGSADATMTLSYIAIPLIGKFYFQNRGQGLFVKGGVYSAFLNNKSLEVNGRTINSDKLETRNFDMLASVGVGGVYNLGTERDFSFDLTYQQSLADFESAGGATKLRNEGFLLTMGVML